MDSCCVNFRLQYFKTSFFFILSFYYEHRFLKSCDCSILIYVLQCSSLMLTLFWWTKCSKCGLYGQIIWKDSTPYWHSCCSGVISVLLGNNCCESVFKKKFFTQACYHYTYSFALFQSLNWHQLLNLWAKTQMNNVGPY